MNKHPIAQGPFEPTWESLLQFQCPDWFRDAKFGIWSHWGPQAVPMYGDWYARHMYVEGSDQYRYHLRKYGHPSKFGYKGIVELWKAERFNPEALMDKFVKAGAKYFVAQAAHHDNFHNWNSKHHSWNSVNHGPKRDVVREWQTAAKAHGLPFGLSEHIGATFSWWTVNKGQDKAGPYAGVPYDGANPAYKELYLDNQGAKPLEEEWYTTDTRWPERWFAYVQDMIDQFQPDLLYSDGGVPFGQAGLDAIAHLYNTSANLHSGINSAVYNQKDKSPAVHPVGVFDIERSYESEIVPYVWQTDTSIGDWFYNVRDAYKTPTHIAETLVDIVSKNGNLLLNVPQLPDGTLDDECEFLLDQTAKWIRVVGEGIHGTRPWTKFGEGPSRVKIGRFKEDETEWTIEDFRFTAKGSNVYAFLMKWPEGGKAVIRSLAGQPVTGVELLGHGPVPYTIDRRGLTIDLPLEKPCAYVQCLSVRLAEYVTVL